MTRARGQAGLTLLETLVMIAVTALVGAALVNVATRANAANYARASRIIDADTLQRVEAELRAAGAAAQSSVATIYSFSGDSRSAQWWTIGYEPCAKGDGVTTFAIEATAGGERLVRRCGSRSEVLARWPPGWRGDFAFSADGYAWAAAPPQAEPRMEGGEQGVYLRLRVRGPGAAEHVSVIRLAGAASASLSVLDMEDAP